MKLDGLCLDLRQVGQDLSGTPEVVDTTMVACRCRNDDQHLWLSTPSAHFELLVMLDALSLCCNEWPTGGALAVARRACGSGLRHAFGAVPGLSRTGLRVYRYNLVRPGTSDDATDHQAVTSFEQIIYRGQTGLNQHNFKSIPTARLSLAYSVYQASRGPAGPYKSPAGHETPMTESPPELDALHNLVNSFQQEICHLTELCGLRVSGKLRNLQQVWSESQNLLLTLSVSADSALPAVTQELSCLEVNAGHISAQLHLLTSLSIKASAELTGLGLCAG